MYHLPASFCEFVCMIKKASYIHLLEYVLFHKLITSETISHKLVKYYTILCQLIECYLNQSIYNI